VKASVAASGVRKGQQAAGGKGRVGCAGSCGGNQAAVTGVRGSSAAAGKAGGVVCPPTGSKRALVVGSMCRVVEIYAEGRTLSP